MNIRSLFGVCLLATAMFNPAHAGVLFSNVTIDADTYVEASFALIDYDTESETIANLSAISNHPPAEPGALEFVSRSKRLRGR